MNLFTATLIHETNSFSPIPTDLDSYRETFLYLPSSGEGSGYKDSLVADINISQMAGKRGHQVHQGLIAGAQPSMPMNAEAWSCLRNEILSDIEKSLPLDAVVLFLHGAQMAQCEGDCEGALLERIREIAGPDVVIGVSFDLHANVSQKMADMADLLVSCQEYPHIDFESRTQHLLDLVEATVSGKIRPVICLQRIPMFGSFYTTREPMRSFVDRLAELQLHQNVLSISLVHGFAWADVADAGASICVTCDGDAPTAERLAAELASDFFAMRDQVITPTLNVDDALDQALAAAGGPAVIADTTDNPGGGAPGDSTWILDRILQRGISDVAIAMIYDPVAAGIAAAAGVGAELDLRVGGKLCPLSGSPLDLSVRVTCVRDDGMQLRETSRRRFGVASAVETNGVEIVLCSVREQTFTSECFTELGIDPLCKRMLVVKSHQHFHDCFARFAAAVIYCTPPGVVTRDFSGLPYQHITRPVWPIDQPPFEAHGRTWG